MTKAEQRALEAYPDECFVSVEYASMARSFYVEGYEQAEKDLELTWADIEHIYSIMLCLDKEKYPPMSVAFYKEALMIFNEDKKEAKK